ncbi:NPC intracellular cholesterol transporter 2-like [Danaus plexippus]|nr:NPC intracellular cholesterol transporter 2-like [Danaus plexippus]
MFFLSVFVLTIALTTATDVQQCPGSSVENLKENVQLSPCSRLPCRLKRGSKQFITITFTPESDLPDLKNQVTALLLGIPFPFVGVDGVSVCDKLENEKGEKVSCPLKAGTKYVYKDSFPVHNFYPTVDAKVHWALSNEDKNVICFEVPIKIK